MHNIYYPQLIIIWKMVYEKLFLQDNLKGQWQMWLQNWDKDPQFNIC